MSYILDALNKSESERQRQAIPGIESLREAEHRGGGRASRFAAALIIFGIFGVVSAAAAYYFLEQSNRSASQPEDLLVERTTPPAAGSQPPAQALPAEAANGTLEAPAAASPVSFGTPELIAPEPRPPAAERLPSAEPEVTTTFADLPASVQRRVPEINVTAHIYSSDPALRVVKIDDAPIREGDSLKGGLTLVQITELGIVLGIDNHRFRVDFLQDWNH